MDQEQLIKACIEACQKCASACLECAQACLRES